jgi:hypothetical protein
MSNEVATTIVHLENRKVPKEVNGCVITHVSLSHPHPDSQSILKQA